MQYIKLSELTTQIKTTLQNAFADTAYWVVADITNYSFHNAKNYHYFDLVEKAEDSNNIQAKICACAWGTGNNKIRDFERVTGQPFKNDIHVLVKVSVDYHAIHGLKLTVLDVDVNFTIGILEQQRQRTLERLLQECPGFVCKVGDCYKTRNKELPHSSVIQHIAIVSSHLSAGFQDFCHTIENNSFNYKFRIDNYFTSVQGAASSAEMYDKLLQIYNTGIKYDTVVIIRGGGAQTDFIVFDQFPLSKIVAKFPIPIITGIGHQKNETIVDLMAHTCTKTPTKAAEFIIAHNKCFEDKLLSLEKSVIIRSQQLVSSHQQSLSQINTSLVNNARTIINSNKDRLVTVNQVTINHSKSILYDKHKCILNLYTHILSKPRIIVSEKQCEIDNTVKNLKTFIKMNFANQRGSVNHFNSVFKLMSIDNILKKGFAIIRKDGDITSDVDKLNNGNKISIILSGKDLNATINSKTDYHGREFNL